MTKYNFLVLNGMLLMLILSSGCENPLKRAARNVEYSAYELVGIEKRELLKNRVDDARKEQKEAGDDFRDALQKLKDVYGFEGGKLERKYNSLNDSYEKAAKQSEDVKTSIRKVETVAGDLFKEWENEIQSIQTASLKERSRSTLHATQNRYAQMHTKLKMAESKLDPVVHQLRDHVLFLKHNLNAAAIGSLKTEGNRIQKDVEVLISEMNISISSADQFIKDMKAVE